MAKTKKADSAEMVRFNLSLAKDTKEFLELMSDVTGLNQTELIQQAIFEFRTRNLDLVNKAKELQTKMAAARAEIKPEGGGDSEA